MKRTRSASRPQGGKGSFFYLRGSGGKRARTAQSCKTWGCFSQYLKDGFRYGEEKSAKEKATNGPWASEEALEGGEEETEEALVETDC